MNHEAVQQVDDQHVSTRVRETAEKLRRHIQASGLRPGDRYITTEDAGQLLGESVTTMQRAMALLAQHKILERRPKAGTFIGEAAAPRNAGLPCLHFLLPEQCISEPGMQQTLWSRIEGVRATLPDITVQLHFVPKRDVAYARQVVEQAGASLAGIVLLLSSRPMRAFFNQSGIPTVVMGSVEPDLPNLCWVDLDQAQTGRLLAAHLLERGHRRLATIMRDVWSVGEHQLHDGIGETMAEAGLATNALVVRSVPMERSAVVELVRGMLYEPNSPTGFICRTAFQADCVVEAVAAEGIAKKVDVVVCQRPASDGQIKYTCALSDMSDGEIGRVVGEMMSELLRHKTSASCGRLLPVRLHRAG